MRNIAMLAAVACAAAACAAAAVSLHPPSVRAGQPAAPDAWWPSYGGGLANARAAALRDVAPETVGRLRPAWSFATGVVGQFETSPVVTGGSVYFTTGPDGGVFALDAATGQPRWHYRPRVGPAATLFAVNRGVAVDGGRVFTSTLDDQLIALDAATGSPRWSVRVGNPRDGLSEAAAPLAWNGLVFVGSSGGELGVRGSYSAYRQSDGHLVWRWWSVSPGWEGRYTARVRGLDLHRDLARERREALRRRDAWRHGGGAIWMSPAIDAARGLIVLSTGNPAPAFNGDSRPGDNLYTDCIVALDARTGRLHWYFQETPHDVWDYDASSPPVLVDVRDAHGRIVPAVAQAGKTGTVYVVDRRNGALIRTSAPFVPQPHLYAPVGAAPSPVQPGDGGGALGPVAYDEAAHALFVAGNVLPERAVRSEPGDWKPGGFVWKGGDMAETGDHEASLLSRIDLDTGRIAWQTPIGEAMFGGPLYADGLVFAGEQTSGIVHAVDARTGAVRWSAHPGQMLREHPSIGERIADLIARLVRRRYGGAPLDGDIHAPPVAYRAGGREYVLVATNLFGSRWHAAGDTLYAFALPR